MYKIYQIINIDGERYVGSTKQSLQRRYNQHKHPHENKCASHNLMKKPHRIMLIETLGTDKQQALRRERYWIDTLKNVVNVCIPRDKEESKILTRESGKQYRRRMSSYQRTWGDVIDSRRNCNNLLMIDPSIFENLSFKNNI